MKKLNKHHVGLLSQVLSGVLNVALCSIKFYIGTITNSISILQDAYNNLGDVGSSVVGGIGVGLAGKKPTEKYPHGFGRVEEVAALFMNIVFLFFGAYFIWSSAERFVMPFPISFSWWSFVVIAITMAIKVGMFVGLAYKVDKSPVIKANMLDSILDSGITAMTLVAYGVSYASNMPVLDAIFGMVIGIVIVIAMIRNLIETIERMVGSTQLNEKIEETFEELGIKVKTYKAYSYGRRIESVVQLYEEITKEQVQELEKRNIYIISVQFMDQEKGEN